MPAFLHPDTSPARRIGVGVGAIAAAAALSVATFSNPQLSRSVSDGVGAAINGFTTVAAMLAERSPGERPKGALASLKQKKRTAAHQRALPKVRPPAPAGPYAILSAPPTPEVIPPVAGTPLYNSVASGPPTAIVPTTGGPAGPPLLAIAPPPSGGGGIVTPGSPSQPGVPITPTTPGVPETPVTPVPEPASWSLMLLGFATIGYVVRRRGRARSQRAID